MHQGDVCTCYGMLCTLVEAIGAAPGSRQVVLKLVPVMIQLLWTILVIDSSLETEAMVLTNGFSMPAGSRRRSQSKLFSLPKPSSTSWGLHLYLVLCRNYTKRMKCKIHPPVHLYVQPYVHFQLRTIDGERATATTIDIVWSYAFCDIV